MKKRRGSIRGEVRVSVFCPYPERVINLCAENGIGFRGLKRKGEAETEMTVSPTGAKRLRELERRGYFSVKEKGRSGAPFFLMGLRQRYALFLGLILAIGTVWTSSFYIWQIEVSGNEEIPTAVILAALRDEGIKPGISAFSVDNRMLENRLVLKLPKLAWITVNVRGSTAWVIVREKIEKPVREIKSEVRAVRGGVITSVVVTRGAALVQPGDTVDKGDILCESFPWEERAEAVVKARTWRELSASMPLDCIKKSYTGAEKRRETLVFGEKRINFYLTGGNPYMNCDKITESRRLRISENGLLPLSLCAVELCEWTPSAGTLSEAEAEAILKARLISRLNGDIGAGSVTSTEFSKTVENGVLTLTLSAECLEEISG